MPATHFPTLLREEIAELEAEHADLTTELDLLTSDTNLSADEITSRANEIATRATDIDVLLEAKQTRLADLDEIAAARSKFPIPGSTRSGPNQNRSDWTSEEHRGLATIDDAHRCGTLPDHAAEKATRLIETGQTGERSLAARWASAAGDPAYRTAFARLLADPVRGHLLWTEAEQVAYRAVATVQSEMEGRAMSTTGANGGHMIPLTLDPAIMLSSDGTNNPLRQLARTVQTTTNAWQGVLSAGATAEWKAEAAEAADGSPTLTAPSIPVFSGDVFVPYTHEVGMDVEGFFEELTRITLDAADNLQATAFTTGNGSTAPQGIVTGLVGHRVGDQRWRLRGARLCRPVQPAVGTPGPVLRGRLVVVAHRDGKHVPPDGDDQRRASSSPSCATPRRCSWASRGSSAPTWTARSTPPPPRTTTW